LSKGYLCEKAARLDHYQNTADRLEAPLRRTKDGSYEAIGWDTAIQEIADRLLEIRETYGGGAFISCGGGQANHLTQIYGSAINVAMESPWNTNSLAQEKTGEFWIDGRLFGHQGANTTHDIEKAEVVVFVGKNPWQSHGFPEARKQLKAIAGDPSRKLIVIDPVVTDTARLADIHLRVRPGGDAFLLSALCAIIVTEQGLMDEQFLSRRTTGSERVVEVLSKVPVEDFCQRAGVSVDQVAEVARVIGQATSTTVVEDLGIQQSLHSTLNSYLEKLIYLLTGNMGCEGGVNINFGPGESPGGHTPEGADAIVTPVTGHRIIKNLVPCNLLPDEILTDHPARFRAMWVNSANPVVTYPDSQRMAEAMEGLDLLVVVDVAMTETARHAHYVLPAATQFEKWETSLLYLRATFPENTFHLRAPVLPARPGALPESEIVTRVVRAMGEISNDFSDLHQAASAGRAAFATAFAAASAADPQVGRYPSIALYETLGKTLPEGAASAAVLWPMAHSIAATAPEAVRRAGHAGEGWELGEALFDAMLSDRSGMVLTLHEYDDNWNRLQTADRRVQLAIDEMLAEIEALKDEALPVDPEYPFILCAGDRRSSNANAIMRDPAWRRGDTVGTLRVHSEDATGLGLEHGQRARITSNRSSIETDIEITDTVPAGYVSMPHGFGMLYPDQDGELRPQGAMVNLLTDAGHRCAIAGTPYHKYVPVRIEKIVVDG
jgi:anaerobic selenocysteine-containing dehydrogenase